MNGVSLLFLAVGGVESAAAKVPSQLDPSPTMLMLTWVTFAIAAVVLYRIGWKPVIRALDKREADIRKALDEAAAARAQTDSAVETQKRVLAEADAKARQIVEDARRSADAMADAIGEKARAEAQSMVEEATREIDRHRLDAVESLRREAAELAIEVAGRILADRGAGPDGRAFTERMQRSLEPDARP